MRAFSRDAKTHFYQYQSLPRNYTQEKRMNELYTLKDHEVKVGIYKYSTNDDLGKGYSSKVYKGVEIQRTHKRYAIKVIELKKFRGSNLELLEAEIEIHKNLVHQNVVRLYQVVKTAYYYYIIMEYCPHGNLHEYIKQKKKLTQKNSVEIMEQVLAGTRYLMTQGVIHRDLKPANILRIGNKWKISDFGFAVKSKYGFKDRMNVGTPLYMSPESLKKSYYSAKTDIFALGVIFYEMVQGKTPWESKHEKELLDKIKEELVIPNTIKNQKIKQFIIRSCDLNQAKRMSRQELFQFQLQPKEGQQSTEKGSLLADSMSRALNHSRRPSILTEKMGQEDLNVEIDFLYRQFLFVKHLFSCVRNFESFLLDKDGKQRLILTLFKLLLKLSRFLSDKKQNYFRLKHWQELTASKPYKELYQHIIDQTELYEKEYLEQIKLNDIKNIRAVNKKFPDLCHHNMVPASFYDILQDYLVNFIRHHNHEVMLLLSKEDAKGESSLQNVKTAISSAQNIVSAQKSKTEEVKDTLASDSQKKYSIKSSRDVFPPKGQQIQMTILFSQPKKESRLASKIISKRQSKASQNRNSKMEEKSNKNSQRSLTLHDKYQALQSLYTIYRVTELRCTHEEEKDLVIQKIKVTQNYMESKLQKNDYIDLRRLLRGI